MNESCANTGYHRKYAVRLLNGPPPEPVRRRARGRRMPGYRPEVVSVLAAVEGGIDD